jgi:hypothetical protein
MDSPLSTVYINRGSNCRDGPRRAPGLWDRTLPSLPLPPVMGRCPTHLTRRLPLITGGRSTKRKTRTHIRGFCWRDGRRRVDLYGHHHRTHPPQLGGRVRGFPTQQAYCAERWALRLYVLLSLFSFNEDEC